jgi:16S rRNA (cytosine967-C5)-methyltransferase
MERIPDYAAVNSAVDITRKKVNKTMAGVCNGVLRNLIRSKDEITYPPLHSLAYLAVYYSQPEWLVQLWLECYGTEVTEKMLAYMNRRPFLSLRVNTIRTDIDTLSREFAREGVGSKPSELIRNSLIIETMETSIDRLNSYQSGLFYIQNEASMLAADILNPHDGEYILDLCSGVGGKATHFAEKMKNQGLIKAVEMYPHKLAILNDNCQRLGINIIETEQNDILKMNSDSVWQRVFLDAPCSGLGVLNRRADARWRKEPGEIEKITILQRDLLEKAGEMTAPGGILVYSTCTVNPAENDQVVLSFLENHQEFRPDSFAEEIRYFPLDQTDREMTEKGRLTIIPGKYGCDGMFYTRLRRSM